MARWTSPWRSCGRWFRHTELHAIAVVFAEPAQLPPAVLTGEEEEKALKEAADAAAKAAELAARMESSKKWSEGST